MLFQLTALCWPRVAGQPVGAARAGDVFQPKICFFAAGNIPPWTELTYDYGAQYVTENLEGKCHCGAPACRGSAGGGAVPGDAEDEE